MARFIFAVACILVIFTAAPVASSKPYGKSKGRAVDQGEMVTYVGCLRVDHHGQRFLLTDIDGPNAPRGRSWKTGFVTRRTVHMEVIGARGMKLRENAGRLVRITGRRTGNHLRAESMKYAGASCR